MRRKAFLCFNDWAGTEKVPVEIVGETPKRFRIRSDKEIRLAGRSRYLRPGETALVPKTAVRIEEA